jgi:RNA polymerase sigma-70 factor (ECF subfamily)
VKANLHHLQKIITLQQERWIMFRIANETTAPTECQWENWADEELLLEYRSTGVREAFDQLVHRYERELNHYLYRHLGNSANAEDVFQKTFLAVLKDCDQFDASREFRPWLYKIATNKAIDYQREAKHFRVISQVEDDSEAGSIADNIVGNEPEPFEGPMDREIAGKVREAVGKLPKSLKQAVYMVYFQGMTCREAADVIGVHYTTLALRVNRAVGKLNFLLKNVG